MKGLHITVVFTMLLIVAATAENPRNVLICAVMNTDCGPCSCMDSLFIHKIMPAFPPTIIVAFHRPGSHFNFYQGNKVIRDFNYRLAIL